MQNGKQQMYVFCTLNKSISQFIYYMFDQLQMRFIVHTETQTHVKH